ncbi:hypothetical protein PanWU01x14_290060 [Parasponia andersonii]|uniref:Uncharacterized protein n=1 Tax=Parasponia andersonii TaxID=3476 RepID=A0A2P5AXY2_PARAD|nr:hypothetical protein PanWU01x14_290060 [Parasponia andersonii]
MSYTKPKVNRGFDSADSGSDGESRPHFEEVLEWEQEQELLKHNTSLIIRPVSYQISDAKSTSVKEVTQNNLQADALDVEMISVAIAYTMPHHKVIPVAKAGDEITTTNDSDLVEVALNSKSPIVEICNNSNNDSPAINLTISEAESPVKMKQTSGAKRRLMEEHIEISPVGKKPHSMMIREEDELDVLLVSSALRNCRT